MKIETLKNRRPKLIGGILIFIMLITVIVTTVSYAKYDIRQNIAIARGKINYTPYDFKLMAMYQDNEEITSIPNDGYIIDEEKTYCYTTSSTNKVYDLMYTDKYGKHILNNVDKNAKCYLYFKSDTIYTESILNGTDPVLKDGLIPVIIKGDGTVIKASLYSEWYNYSEKVWANAVILENGNDTYKVGDVIPEAEIESYFVWIPRYKYKIWNTGLYDSTIQLYQPGSTTDFLTYDSTTLSYPATINGSARTIEVVFENKTTAVSNGSAVGEYLTHPAFTAFNTNGLWVGKFETGYSGATSTSEAQKNSTDATKVIIKPNVYSWRSNPVSNMFVVGLNYKDEYTSHMMKNTEWGAVAYLSLFDYGRDGEVNINNNQGYLTGYSATTASDQSTFANSCKPSWGTTMCTTDLVYTQPYNTAVGYNASTTGNISGIYDMSGGSWEYMAAYMAGYGMKTSNNVSSGFTQDPATQYGTQYFDVYQNETNTWYAYSNRILGDATSELGPFYIYKDGDGSNRGHNGWFADNSYFVASTNPWVDRGGGRSYGLITSQLCFGRGTGAAVGGHSFRIVLAI